MINSLYFHIILGIPWLMIQISFGRFEVQCESGYCQQWCLAKSGTKETRNSMGKTTSFCVQQIQGGNNLPIPAKYWDFANVFDKRNADILPPHHSCICPNDLQPRAKIPFEWIYPLSNQNSEPYRNTLMRTWQKTLPVFCQCIGEQWFIVSCEVFPASIHLRYYCCWPLYTWPPTQTSQSRMGFSH